MVGEEESKKKMETVKKNYMIADALYDSFILDTRMDIRTNATERWSNGSL